MDERSIIVIASFLAKVNFEVKITCLYHCITLIYTFKRYLKTLYTSKIEQVRIFPDLGNSDFQNKLSKVGMWVCDFGGVFLSPFFPGDPATHSSAMCA